MVASWDKSWRGASLGFRTGGAWLEEAPALTKNRSSRQVYIDSRVGASKEQAGSNHRVTLHVVGSLLSPRLSPGDTGVLLWKDQEGRNHLVSDIRSHRFFKTIDWAELEGRKPRITSESEPICEEPSNNNMPLNSCINYLDREAPLSPKEQEYFTGFSYMSDSLMMSPMDLLSPPPSLPKNQEAHKLEEPEKKPHFTDCSDKSEHQKVEPMDGSSLLPLNNHGPVPTPMENHYKEALQQLAEQMVFFLPPPAVRQENLFTPWPMDYEEAHKNLKAKEAELYV
ncbi:uncharacterized protein LOC143934182 [Lithobates pipiens]